MAHAKKMVEVSSQRLSRNFLIKRGKTIIFNGLLQVQDELGRKKCI